MKIDKSNSWKSSGSADAVYGLGFIGAVVYFVQHGATTADKLLGVLKAIVWPALAVYKLFGLWKF